jgi:alpha-N-arabinofuranosidase
MNKLLPLLTLFWLLLAKAQGQEASLQMGQSTGQIISKYIYGEFAEHLGRCIYDGFYRNGRIRMDIVEAMRKIKIPLLRWPGGCFADDYHWRDGVGPLDKRARNVNATWGMVPEDNSFGTDEFLHLCSLIGCEPYIAGNVGSGTPDELESWIEYCNFDGISDNADLRAHNGHKGPYYVRFWGIGNESWGCGGRMTPETYAAKYRTFANYTRSYPGSPIMRIVSGAEDDDYNWTEYMMGHISKRFMQGIGVHYYASAVGSGTAFSEAEYFKGLQSALRMEEIVSKHSAIMDKYDPEKKVWLIIDEWGIALNDDWKADQSLMYQQNSLRDALIAATTLNIFNNHCDRIRMANLAQTVNVLQALVLTSGDSMLLTPTYYVFDLYKAHQDAKWLPVPLTSNPYYVNKGDSIPAINASASEDSNKVIHVSLVNLDPNRHITVSMKINGNRYSTVSGKVLTSEQYTNVNTFSAPGKIAIQAFSDYQKENGTLRVNMPPKAVVLLELTL